MNWEDFALLLMNENLAIEKDRVILFSSTCNNVLAISWWPALFGGRHRGTR
jgi:hypothetical protein